ncbi:hypothetical protein Chor_010903 [Crotalus horridus]
MCATGDPVFSTPYLLAKKSGQRLQMEFLHHNKFSECSRRWCMLESGFLSYYENEKMATPSGTLDISEVICLVIHKSEDTLPMGAMFTFEIYLLSERAFLFGVETAHSQRKWTRAIAKHFVPELAQGKDDWFKFVNGSAFHVSAISSCVQNGEKTDVLLLVEKGRTLYIRGHTKLDFTVWRSAIEKAAGTDGNMLEDQQLSKNDVPIIVTSCIAFVMQYGLGSKHIYLKNGDPLCVRQLLEDFKKDARSVKLRTGKNRLEDVTDTLKCFLSEIDDALLTKELYPFWISALDTLDDKERKCSEINLMDPHHLAMALSSCLFQTKGQTSEEVDVVEDLIINYVQLFDIQQDQVKQMDIENSFITKWKDTQISQAGDLLIEVYVERKEHDSSIIIRISPTVEAEELTNDVLGIKNITPHKDDTWATFEVIENGELERPLHCTENILEQILHWSSLASPSNASLIVKKFPTVGLMGEAESELRIRQSSKAEKAFPVNSMKLYLGVKKKLKPPTK